LRFSAAWSRDLTAPVVPRWFAGRVGRWGAPDRGQRIEQRTVAGPEPKETLVSPLLRVSRKRTQMRAPHDQPGVSAFRFARRTHMRRPHAPKGVGASVFAKSVVNPAPRSAALAHP